MRFLRSVHPLWFAVPFLLAPGAVWIALDHSVWPWDQAWYGEASVDLWWGLTHSLRAWLVSMLTALRAKPPGIIWLAQLFVPLRHVFGSVEAALLASILATNAVLLIVIYQIGRLISPTEKLTAVAGVVFTAATQAFVGLSQQFFVEPLQAVAAAWVMWIALRCREWPNARILIHLAGAALLGALAKATTPVYCFVFWAYILAVVLRRPLEFDLPAEWRRGSSRWLMLACGSVLPPTAAWYAFNLKFVWEHVRLASSGDVALHYGFRASFWQKLIVWCGLVRNFFLAPALLWVMAVAIAAAAAGWLLYRGATRRTAKVALLLGLLQTAAVVALFSINDAVDPRYLFALMVNVATVFMACCSLIRSRTVVALVLLACAGQWVAVNRLALGGKELMRESPWVTAPQQDSRKYEEMTRVVQRTAVSPARYNIVGLDEPWFNANSAAFFAAKNRLDTGTRTFYTSLGYAEHDTAAALRRLESLRIQYFITLDEPFQAKPPGFLNLVSLPVLRQLKQDSRFNPVPFPSNAGIVVLEGPWQGAK